MINCIYLKMTVSEFKKIYPQWKDLKGDALWNQMEAIALANAEPATEEDLKKFFEEPKTVSDLPLESYRMFFIDMATGEAVDHEGKPIQKDEFITVPKPNKTDVGHSKRQS